MFEMSYGICLMITGSILSAERSCGESGIAFH